MEAKGLSHTYTCIHSLPIKVVNPKGNWSWIFIGRTDTEAETPILWPPDAKNWLIGKDPDGGKDWRQEEKGMTEDAMVGWHHWLKGPEFEQTLGVGDGQGGLACCYSWGRKESDTTEWLNWTELNYTKIFNCVERSKLRKILKEMVMPNLLTCVCVQVKMQQLKSDME